MEGLELCVRPPNSLLGKLRLIVTVLRGRLAVLCAPRIDAENLQTRKENKNSR
jgi:hypothetical protein